jgi:glutamyl-tRNA synthetase
MRVRFAPSPTGVLHIGGARTALYNWLLARGSGGEFVLRIEDTDRERSTPENVDLILDALRWLELDWDEGPLSQWERRENHQAAVTELLKSGAAYQDEGAVRFRVPDEGEITFTDAVLGDVTNPYSAINDFVIQRSDGSPLYNLAVAVDDRDMGITHVVRGQDHVSNTPRQLMLLRALGAEPPVYAHIPLLHGPDGKKLVERFALERVSKNPAVFDEQKLRWMNGRYMRELPLDELRDRLQCFYNRDIPPEIVEISREKMQTLADFWPLAGTLVERPSDFDEKAWNQWGSSPHLGEIRAGLVEAEGWEADDIEVVLRRIVDEHGVKPKEVFQPLRVALTGTTVSPGIFESVAALGREETLARLDKALQKAK